MELCISPDWSPLWKRPYLIPNKCANPEVADSLYRSHKITKLGKGFPSVKAFVLNGFQALTLILGFSLGAEFLLEQNPLLNT